MVKIIGHHGTDKISGYEVLQPDNMFIISRMDKDKNRCHKLHFNEYVIIVSDLKAKTVEILDLNSRESYDLFHGQKDILLNRLKKTKFSLSTVTPITRDGSIINDICSLLPYKIVKLTCYVKRVRERIYNIKSRIPNCTILSVRDVKCIITKELQREGVLNAS